MSEIEPILVGTTGEIPEGEALFVPAATTGTVPIGIFHAETGGFYALDDACTHGQASLSEGFIEDDKIECPAHSGTFCLRTGKALTMPLTQDTNTHKLILDGENILLCPGVPAADTADAE